MSDGGDSTLSGGQWRTIGVLALPTLGLALATTVVTTYLPVVASGFIDSNVVIGLLIGAEGLMALMLPIAAGTWSDQLQTRLGGRLPFVLAGTPVMALALIALGFVNSVGTAAAVLLLFFGAYFVAYEPYRALYPDLVEEDIAGRSQSGQAVARGAGTGLALVFGGLLLSIGQIVPFATAAVILMGATGAFAHVMLRRRGVPDQGRPDEERSPREAARDVWHIVRDRPLVQTFIAANTLWELSLAALKTFVVLYITQGLGMSLSAASGIIGAAAAFVLAGAAISGKLGDRFGTRRVMAWAGAGYGAGLLMPFVTQSPALLVPAIPFIAFGGGVLMTLPYAMLFPLMPEGERGALTGLYSFTRGMGTMLGPILAGLAIEIGEGPLSQTDGYAAMWLVCAAAVIGSVPLVQRMRRQGGEDGTADSG